MKKNVLIYRSEGTDDVCIYCDTVEEAINCFRGDVEATIDGQNTGELEITIRTAALTEDEIKSLQEM